MFLAIDWRTIETRAAARCPVIRKHSVFRWCPNWGYPKISHHSVHGAGWGAALGNSQTTAFSPGSTARCISGNPPVFLPRDLKLPVGHRPCKTATEAVPLARASSSCSLSEKARPARNPSRHGGGRGGAVARLPLPQKAPTNNIHANDNAAASSLPSKLRVR